MEIIFHFCQEFDFSLWYGIVIYLYSHHISISIPISIMQWFFKCFHQLFSCLEVCFKGKNEGLFLERFQKNSFFWAILKNSSQLFLRIKFCLGSQIWKTVFSTYSWFKYYTLIYAAKVFEVFIIFLIISLNTLLKTTENT